MIKAITAAALLNGDISKAICWYRNEPITEYDHRPQPNWLRKGILKQC